MALYFLHYDGFFPLYEVRTLVRELLQELHSLFFLKNSQNLIKNRNLVILTLMNQRKHLKFKLILRF